MINDLWCCSELKHGGEGDDRHHDDSGADSEAESDHVTREPEADDIVMRGGAESPPLPCDKESDIDSTVSNPLEDSEYVHRCQARDTQPPGRRMIQYHE
jgi:hypothetical protein